MLEKLALTVFQRGKKREKGSHLKGLALAWLGWVIGGGEIVILCLFGKLKFRLNKECICDPEMTS